MVKWWKANPGKGKHGVPDKAVHKLGKKWDADREQKEKEKKDE